MKEPRTFFDVCVLLGEMLIFTLFVEWFVGTYILKRLRLSRFFYAFAVLLATALLVFGAVRRDVSSGIQETPPNQPANAIGLIIGLTIGGGVAFTTAVAFVSKRIGPYMLAALVIAFFILGVIAFMLLRSLIAPEMLTNNDLFFVSVAVSLTLVGTGHLAFRPLFSSTPKPAKYNPIVDPLSFGEKRRQRLNKKRAGK